MRRVPVTQKHIDLGVANDAVFCGLALAMRDAGYKRVMVSDMFIMTSTFKYGVTPEVGEWVNWHDDHADRSELYTGVLLIDDDEMTIDFEHEEESA